MSTTTMTAPTRFTAARRPELVASVLDPHQATTLAGHLPEIRIDILEDLGSLDPFADQDRAARLAEAVAAIHAIGSAVASARPGCPVRITGTRVAMRDVLSRVLIETSKSPEEQDADDLAVHAEQLRHAEAMVADLEVATVLPTGAR